MGFQSVLQVGQIAIYGNGYVDRTGDGFPKIGDGLLTGSVYHIWSGGQTYVYGNDKVLFKDEEIVCRVVTDEGHTFTIIPARLAIKQDPLL